MRAGFSLLELSIVLVIIGLLAGGVMTGQALIRAAEMRSIITEYQKFTTAANTFRDKYQAIPGDMKNATAFWGKDNTNCPTHTGANATPGTCNGDGNGIMLQAYAVSGWGEIFGLWQHLSMAGMVEGTYSGLAGAAAVNDTLIGTNAPASKLTNAGWGVQNRANFAGDSNVYAYDYGNALTFGSVLSGNPPLGTAVKPEEAWNIDTKLDDGKPATGRMISVYWGNGGSGANRCTNGTSVSDTASGYNLANSAVQCAFYFAKFM